MRRRLLAVLLALAVAACTFSRDVSIKTHQLDRPLAGGLVNSFNVEEQLKNGYVPEVLEFLAASGRSLESTRMLRLTGQALLERGDYRAAVLPLERAHAEEGRLAYRGEAAWLLSQAHYWGGNLGDAARWARTAQSEGVRVPDGWVAFLQSGLGRAVYGGPAPGDRTAMAMIFGRPDLPRVDVQVNDRQAGGIVFDTGASISLLTEEAADRLGVERVPDAVASAYGLHRVEFPLHFGWASTVKLGNVTLRNVPFGILPNDALEFDTEGSGSFRFIGVLGAHLLKEFDWQLDYNRHRIQGIKLDPAVPRGSKGQNLFFRRLKPMVRASLFQQPWFLFLFDTGSEPTMVTRSGLRRAKTGGMETAYPVTLEGIGKSKVSWGKLSNVTVGIDRFMIQYKDMVVKEENEGIEDGVLGSSFLLHFIVEIRFGAMTLTLERPYERLLREGGSAGETGITTSASPRI